MIDLTLTWRDNTPPLSDGRALRADALAARDPAQLAAQPLRAGRHTVTLADAFTIDRADDDALTAPRLTLVDLPPTDYLAASMQAGQVIVQGDAGHHAGASMTGGTLTIVGSAGDYAGGCDRNTPRGLNGGSIYIQGDVGHYLADRMRRGIILVQGATGDYPAHALLAGTVVLLTPPASPVGVNMRRGTIVITQPADEAQGPHLTRDGRFPSAQMSALGLLFRHIEKHLPPHTPLHGEYDLYSGDRFVLHRGELWQKVSPA